MSTEIFLVFFLILLFLGCSAFFSASETAITAASKAKLHQLAKDGDKRAAMLRDLQKDLGVIISAMLMGNTLFNAWAVSLTTAVLVSLMGSEGVAYASIVMGSLIIIYAEVMPKILAVQTPERFLLRTAFFLKFLLKILRPVTMAINLIARFNLRLLGVKTKGDVAAHATIEELRGIIDLHHGPGQDVPQERAMLKSILDLGSVQVDEIMVHRKNVTMIDMTRSATEIVEQILSSPFTRIPLWKDDPDNIVGVIHAKALLRAVRAHPGDLNELNILAIAAKPWFVPNSTDLLNQLQAFRERREHFSIVVDEYGAFMGIVTLEDVLEEIVGEISDEHDVLVRGIRPQSDGSYIVDGSVTIRDLNRQCDWDLPDEPAATAGGLVLYEARLIPEVGQVFLLHGFRFEILRRHRNQITLLRVTPHQEGASFLQASKPSTSEHVT
jgi:Mg2+/Co2+ transporter CorB